MHGFQIDRKLSSGSFGCVFLCKNKNSEIAAAKIEKNNIKVNQLHYESKILKSIQTSTYFCKYIGYGSIFHDNRYSKYLLMEAMQSDCGKVDKTHSINEKKQLFQSMFDGLEAFHKFGYIHRDIKPRNFCLRFDLPLTAVLVDLGLAKKFINVDGKHIPMEEKHTQVGTLRYSSVYSAALIQQSRRDDIESLIYSMVNMCGCDLPWQNIDENLDKKTKHKRVYNLKRICSPKKVTVESIPGLTKILSNVRQLKFKETPPYELYKSLL